MRKSVGANWVTVLRCKTSLLEKLKPKTMKTILCLFVCASVLGASAAFGDDDSVVTAVYSKVSNGYQRQKMPDGSFKREYYALTKGVYQPGLSPDRSIDGVRYPQIAKIAAQFLALQNYHLAPDAKSANLLLAITWGTTVPLSDSVYRTNTESFFSASNNLAIANRSPTVNDRSVDGIQSPAAAVRDAASDAFAGQLLQQVMFEDIRRQANEHNARLLGYVGAGDAYHDLISDIESERYYLILTAYDFRDLADGGKPKLCWSTRVSVQAQGNRFNETLAVMLNRASRYFGRDSQRLIRRYEPDTNITLGELRTVGYEPKSEPDDNLPR
jgi:hypothetical protein